MTEEDILPRFTLRTRMFNKSWSGVAGGSPIPEWWESDLTIPGNPLTRYEDKDVYYAPKLGVLVSSEGEVLEPTKRQASYADPAFEKVAALLAERAKAPSIDRGIVSMPFGAIHNYGHFLLDGLTSVAALLKRRTQGEYLTPPLKDWQRQHFALLGITPREIADPLCRIGHVTFTSGMTQSMHNPNFHFRDLKSLQSNIPKWTGSRKLYITRNGFKRKMACEDRLIAALRKRGFQVLKPETLPVAQQIAAFRSAKVIVGATGAALANVLYISPGTKVYEIIPRDMTRNPNSHKWVGYLTALNQGDWLPYFCDNVQSDEQMPVIGGIPRAGYLDFDLDVGDFLAFLGRHGGVLDRLLQLMRLVSRGVPNRPEAGTPA